MTDSAVASSSRAISREREQVSWARFAWVAPLAVVASLAVNYVLKLIVQALVPGTTRMPQLNEPLITLTLLGAIAAVVVFALMALTMKRPYTWYPIVATIALLVSWIPDILLAFGGQSALLSMRIMGPLTSIGFGGGPGPGGGPPPGPPGGGPPGGFQPGNIPATPIVQVLILMLLHAATFVVCVVMLTRLTRKPTSVG